MKYYTNDIFESWIVLYRNELYSNLNLEVSIIDENIYCVNSMKEDNNYLLSVTKIDVDHTIYYERQNKIPQNIEKLIIGEGNLEELLLKI